MEYFHLMSELADAANTSDATEHTGEPQLAGYADTHAVSYYGNATEHACWRIDN